MIGVHPGLWTLRGLLVAARQRRLEEWDRCARIAWAVLTPWASQPVDEAKLNRVRAAEAETDYETITAADFGNIFKGLERGNE